LAPFESTVSSGAESGASVADEVVDTGSVATIRAVVAAGATSCSSSVADVLEVGTDDADAVSTVGSASRESSTDEHANKPTHTKIHNRRTTATY